MLDYKDPLVRKQMAAILENIAKKMVQDEDFAKEIFSDFRTEPKPKPSSKKVIIETLSTKTNVFELYQQQGNEDLRTYLKTLSLEELRKVVLDNGLDPAKKVRRWRKGENIIEYIVEAVMKQMAKGEAFLK